MSPPTPAPGQCPIDLIVAPLVTGAVAEVVPQLLFELGCVRPFRQVRVLLATRPIGTLDIQELDPCPVAHSDGGAGEGLRQGFGFGVQS